MVRSKEYLKIWKKRQQWKQLLPYILLAVLSVGACWIFAGRYGIFGAKVDWISQHSVIPELFRQQFYDTGNLFPDFTLQAGGGQNIYNFAYYGLYSPAILLSYLLPFVSMSDYIIAVSVGSLALSVMLLYYWLSRRGVNRKICFGVSLLFLLAGPMIVQSYSQIMFVNYMPWLLMSFLGADRYLEFIKNIREAVQPCEGAECCRRPHPARESVRAHAVLIIGVWGMILTSFYFSIGGMLALAVYGLCRYIEMEERTDGVAKAAVWRNFIKAAAGYIFSMGISVLLSGILLVPTAYSLMQGNHIQSGYTWKDLLFPKMPVEELFYQPYGAGLTTLLLTALLTGLFYRKWQERLLSQICLILLVIPAFAWILNGGLYIRGKVWIPFLPLFCYMIAVYIKKQSEKQVNIKVSAAAYLVTLFFVWHSDTKYSFILLAEGIALLVFYLAFCYLAVCQKKKGQELWLLVPSVCFLAVFLTVCMPSKTRVLEPEFYKTVTNRSYSRLEQKIEKKMTTESEGTDGDSGMYRIEEVGNSRFKAADLNRIRGRKQYLTSIYSSAYSTEYQNFRKDTFGVEQPFRNLMMQSVSENPEFRSLMGVRYILSEKNVPGYRKIMQDGKVAVYENKEVLPMAYVTDQTISDSEYDSLKYPYNQMVFKKAVVVQGEKAKVAQSIKSENRKDKKIQNVTAQSVKAGTKEAQNVTTEDKKKDDIEKLNISGSSWKIRTRKQTQKEITFGRKAKEGEVLYVRFQVKNHRRSKDVAAWLNGVRNKLTAKTHIYYNGNTTFTYAVALNKGEEKAEILLGGGDYDVKNVEAYLGQTGQTLSYHAFRPDWKHTKGNRIEGTVKGMTDGYFVTSVPYDKGFAVKVGGHTVKTEKVNKAFLGFRIGAGTHHVKITYHAPGKRAGMIISFAGILLFAGWMVLISLQIKRISV